MNLDSLLLYIFIFLNCFALLGLKLKNKTKKKVYKICPCKKMAENGTLSTLCMYSAMGGFLYSTTSISFIGFKNLELNLIFLFSLSCAYLGWRLKEN